MKNENAQQTSYMSNTKWRKFFAIMKHHQINYRKTSWKLVGHTEWHDSWRLEGQDVNESEDFTIASDGETVKYMDIEQIKIPRKFKSRSDDFFVKKQDVEKFERLLKRNGNFKIEADSDSLTIFGYK